MTNLAVIYRPEMVKRLGASSKIFYFPTPRPSGSKGAKSSEVELRTLILNLGVNFVDSETLKSAQSFSNNKTEMDYLARKGALIVHQPDAIAEEEEPSNSTTDFKNLEDAFDVIDNCYSEQWLIRSRNRDPRGQIVKRIESRLNELEDRKKARKIQSSAGFGLF